MSREATFLAQARGCKKLGSPFMERLMMLLANNWPEHTVLAKRFSNWEGDIGPLGASLPLRLAGGLHSIVLSGADEALIAAYPPNRVDDEALMETVLQALHQHDSYLCVWLNNPPQTNEVRRSCAFIAAAHWLDKRYGLPIHLSELGASAGLNLQFDKHALQIADGVWGPADAIVRLTPEWRGPKPPTAEPQIISRRGVDINPLRLPSDELRLLSYLWPDQAERIARTRSAVSLQTATVDLGDAIDWLKLRLDEDLTGALHLVCHSIAWQYFSEERQIEGRTAIESAGVRASNDAPLAWLAMEADETPNGAALTLRLWPGDLRISLGRAGFHGEWVDWTG